MNAIGLSGERHGLFGARRNLVAAVVAAVFVCIAMLAMASPARAATIKVTSNADSGAGTLREAVATANGNTEADTITFDLPADSRTITLDSTIGFGRTTYNTTIDGGAEGVTVSGNNASRVFLVVGGNLTVKRLTVSDGNRTTAVAGCCDTEGGGIYNKGGILTVTQSTISGNTAVEGAGIYSDTNLDGTQYTTIENSTISGNHATFRGGGISNYDGRTNITSSTITKNYAPSLYQSSGGGAGVASSADSATETVVANSIISDNSSNCTDGTTRCDRADHGDVDIFSGYAYNSFTSQGYNIIGDSSRVYDNYYHAPQAFTAFTKTGDQKGVTDPKLGPLQDNGGPTQTHALLTGSPAIDNGSTALTTDQRGVSRPQGVGAPLHADVGAFELEVAADTTPPTLTVTHTADGTGGWNKTSPVTVNVSASDSDSGLAGDPTCTDGDNALTLTAGSTAGTWTASVSGEGSHNISCSVTDKANNSSGPQTDTVKIDTIAPSISDLGPTASANGNGWFNTDVTNTFKATDSGSGLSNACNTAFPASSGGGGGGGGGFIGGGGGGGDGLGGAIFNQQGQLTISNQAGENVQAKTTSGEGSAVKVTSDSCTDLAGNTAAGIDSATYQIDKTKPVISASAKTQPDGADYTAGDWTNKSVEVSFSCTDTFAGVDTNTLAGDTLTTSGADQGVTNTGTCTDKAGNTANSATFSNIDIDKTAPEVTLGAASGTAGSNGWYISDVTQRFNATDALSGIDGSTFQDKTSSGQGSSVSITSDAFSDKAGNTATGTAAPFKIDLSDPTITTSLIPANPASSGWYNAATGAPTVGFTCSDSVSGLATACPADYTFANGANQSHEGTVTDRAGRSATTTNVNGINVDLDAPSAPTATTNPASSVANSGGFFKDQVTVSYGGSTDVGPSGIAGYTADQPFTTTGSHNYSGTATDKAGNVSAATTGSVKVDTDVPTVGITGCPTSPVLLNSTQNITVAAGDVGSGLVSNPSGSVSLDTNSVGPKTKTIKVADKVGHSNSATCSYSVKYGFTGFLSPIPQSSYIAGSTIPVKFGLTNAAGTRISDAAAQALVASPCKVKVSFNSGTKNCAAYNATTDTFQFDVKTPKSLASGLYNIVVEVSDGSGVVNSETVQVNIKH